MQAGLTLQCRAFTITKLAEIGTACVKSSHSSLCRHRLCLMQSQWFWPWAVPGLLLTNTNTYRATKPPTQSQRRNGKSMTNSFNSNIA